MKKAWPVMVVGLLMAVSSQGAALYTSTFDTDDEGWLDRDTDEMTVSHNAGFGNAAGSLQGSFAALDDPLVESDAFRATNTTAGGAFVGDYTAISASYYSFDFYAADVLPSDLIVRFHGGGFTFFRTVGSFIASVGSWYSVTAPLNYDGSWVGGTAGNFASALLDVRWVDVIVTRNGQGSQTYYMDNFSLNGSGGGGGGGAVPEPRLGIFALWVGALLLTRKKALARG